MQDRREFGKAVLGTVLAGAILGSAQSVSAQPVLAAEETREFNAGDIHVQWRGGEAVLLLYRIDGKVCRVKGVPSQLGIAISCTNRKVRIKIKNRRLSDGDIFDAEYAEADLM